MVEAAETILDPDRLRAALTELEPLARSAPGRVEIVRAPGRVNLIGEHTDYNQGLVLPVAIDLETWICFVPTDDRTVELTLAGSGERTSFELDRIGPARGSWIDYVAGVARVLTELGIELRGLRGIVAGTLPISVGLASSAALELAAAWALVGPMLRGLDRMALAQAAQRAENEYVGVQCGLMDQFAVTFGPIDAALLLDCRSLTYREVPLALAEHTLVICDSGSRRLLSASAYNQRRLECEAVVAAAAVHDPRVRSLRDVDRDLLDRLRPALEPVLARRAEHVLAENQRVQAVTAALEEGDWVAVGQAFAASHASLRDLYEVSSLELDALVEIAVATPGVVASRLTGAGFGGCTINIVERGFTDGFSSVVAEGYRRRIGLEARVYAVEPASGAGMVPA